MGGGPNIAPSDGHAVGICCSTVSCVVATPHGGILGHVSGEPICIPTASQSVSSSSFPTHASAH